MRMLFVVIVFFASVTTAIACECPDNSSLIEGMDLQIAEREAKLQFVLSGGQESKTGYSNDPSVLTREIQEISKVRDQFIREQSDCEKQCARQLDKSIFDPDTTDPVVSAACPRCAKLQEELTIEDVQLSLAIRNLTLFKNENEQALLDGMEMKKAGPSKIAFDQERMKYAKAYGTYQYLLDRRQRACGTGYGAPNADTSYYHPESFDAEEPLPDDFWESSESELDPDRPLVDEDGRELVVLDSDGNEISPRKYREQQQSIKAHQKKVDEFFALPGLLISIPASIAQAAAEDADRMVDQIRSLDIDIPYGLELTEYGECLRWARLVDQHLEHVLIPASNALNQAERGLPGGSSQKFEELNELEQKVREARKKRDQAMDALIDCNAKYCRKKPIVSAKFEDEPKGSGLNGGDIGVPPAFAPLPIEPLPFVPAPLGLTPLPEPPVFDAPTGLGELPELPGNGTGINPLPPMPLDAIPPGSSPLVGQPKARGELSLQDLLDQRNQAIASGIMRAPAGTCEFEPDDVCLKLGGEEAEQCKIKASIWRDECRAVRDRAGEKSLNYCYARCDVQSTAAQNANFLQQLVLSVVRANDPLNSELLAARRATNEKMLKEASTELQQLEDKLANNKIYIYTNTETGAIIQHNGPFFEPKPPLIHTGEMPAPLTEAQLERRTILHDRITELAKEAVELTTEPAEISAWRPKAIEFWSGNENYSPVACKPEQIAPELAACRAFCDAQMPISKDAGGGPAPLDFCKPNGVLGLLLQPFSRKWIYPPGHAWQAPGYGR